MNESLTQWSIALLIISIPVTIGFVIFCKRIYKK